MQCLLKQFNNKEFSLYQPYIVSLKSKEILEFINFSSTSIRDKINIWKNYNEILLNVSKACYNRFNPSMIYSFNDEIHMVFYNTSDYPDLYNGNINKTLTTMSSFATRVFTKEFIKYNIEFDFTIGAKYAEFYPEYETLNYLVWRQLDCKRNNIITLYRYFNSDVTCKSLDNVTQSLFHALSDLNITYAELDFCIYGNVLKKEIVYVANKEDKDDISPRREFNVSHTSLHENFKENMVKYIQNTYL
jgi:tRNA(His) 5'-end guanylyltransferase